MIDTHVQRQLAQHRLTWLTKTRRPVDPILPAHVALCDELDAARAEIERLTERLAALTPPVKRGRRAAA